MKKDNFDLRAYLVENKMTENSRGEVRRHLGEATLDTRMLNEVFAGPDDHGYSEFETWYADHADEYASEDEAYEYWENNVYGQGGYDNDDIFADLEECDPGLGSDVPLAEQGYSEAEGDDEDPLANFPSLEDIIKSDPNAKKAERAAARDIERAAQAADQDDAAAAAADMADAPADGDAPVEEPAHPNRWVKGDLTMDSLFGQDAENVDILAGNDSMSNDEALQHLFRTHKNYRPNLLQGAVRQAMDYFEKFEKPDKLYLIPAIDRGGYDMNRFNPGHRAVAVVWRPENLAGDSWAQNSPELRGV